jgi:F-type H+-transporting ATPase subunit epsilon
MALPTKITLEIVTPDREIVREQVDEVQVPGSQGYLGILPGHTPLLSTLAVGEMWYRIGEEKQHLALVGGFLEVLPERVTILAELAERAGDLDVARTEAAIARAEELLARPASADVDAERARLAMLRSLLQLQVASKGRTRG